MHQWLNARCAKLLEELNNTPFTDDVDEIKLNLIRSAMREASLELFHRAADNSRKMIEQIHREELSEKVHQAETHSVDDVLKDTETMLEQANTEVELEAPPVTSPPAAQPASDNADSGGLNAALSSSSISEPATSETTTEAEEKPAPKIQISSSIIRRAE